MADTMTDKQAEAAVAEADVWAHDRDDGLTIYTVDLPGLARSVDVEAANKAEARQLAIDHLTAATFDDVQEVAAAARATALDVLGDKSKTTDERLDAALVLLSDPSPDS